MRVYIQLWLGALSVSHLDSTHGFGGGISYKICLFMFKCLKGLAPAYLSDHCVGTAAVPCHSGLRSAVRGDLVVPGHGTEWGSKVFCCWNKLPDGLRDFLVDPTTFARHLKTHLFRAGFSD